MRESIGGTFLLSIVFVFIAIYVCFLALGINYATAYRLKNNIIKIIEQYEGKCDIGTDCLKKIGEYVSNSKYHSTAITKVEVVNKDFCSNAANSVCIEKAYTAKSHLYYKVTTYLSFDFPIVGNIIQMPIKGETNIIVEF